MNLVGYAPTEGLGLEYYCHARNLLSCNGVTDRFSPLRGVALPSGGICSSLVRLLLLEIGSPIVLDNLGGPARVNHHREKSRTYQFTYLTLVGSHSNPLSSWADNIRGLYLL